MKFLHAMPGRFFVALSTLFALCCVAGFPPCHADDAKKDEKKWTPLFDGKTLDGWSVPKYEEGKKAEIKDNCLILGRDDLATGVKYDKPFPKTNYEIMYQAKRANGYDFFGTITFPVKEKFCSFVNGGWGGCAIGLSSINGYDASENETSGFYDFKDRQWYQFRLCVSDDRVTVWFYPVGKDGKIKETSGNDAKAEAEALAEIEKPKVDLALEDKELTTRIEVSPYKPLGITTWNTEGHIRDVKYRELTPEEVDQIKQLPERSRRN